MLVNNVIYSTGYVQPFIYNCYRMTMAKIEVKRDDVYIICHIQTFRLFRHTLIFAIQLHTLCNVKTVVIAGLVLVFPTLSKLGLKTKLRFDIFRCKISQSKTNSSSRLNNGNPSHYIYNSCT